MSRLPTILSRPPPQVLGNLDTGPRRDALLAALPGTLPELVEATGYAGQSLNDDLHVLERHGFVECWRAGEDADVWRERR